MKSTEYKDSYSTPVLTAGKSFILGYTNELEGICNNLPVIIFDDFTTTSKFVNFPFKVKSSAMKILHAYKNINAKYIYYLMQMITSPSDTHKRFWISDYSQKIISIPPFVEQEKIVKMIEILFNQVDSIEEEKQSLLKLIDKTKEKVLDLAMKGKLVAQDPNDEPASVLLARIEKEKQKLVKEGKIKPDKSTTISDDNAYYQNITKNIPNGWANVKFENVLEYEQPNKYIVNSTKYSSIYKTPVLTAGKSFILGYTNEENNIFNQFPVIIFDDFTTASKLVDFPFKVKSSAMKILHVKKGQNINFVFLVMQTVNCISDTHKRFWISDFSQKNLLLPPLNEQNKIVKCVDELFNSLESIRAELS